MRHAFGRTGRLRLAQTGLLASTLLAAGCGWALDGAPLRVPGLGADGRPQPLAALPGPAFVLAPDAGRTLTLRLQLGPVTSRQLLGPPMANTTFQADDVVHAVVTLYKGGFAAGDAQALRSLPRHALVSGSSEILNWIVTAGASAPLPLSWSEYQPLYRTPAGTGCGAGFCIWSDSAA